MGPAEIADERILRSENVTRCGRGGLRRVGPVPGIQAVEPLHAISQREAEISGTPVDHTILNTSNGLCT